MNWSCLTPIVLHGTQHNFCFCWIFFAPQQIPWEKDGLLIFLNLCRKMYFICLCFSMFHSQFYFEYSNLQLIPGALQVAFEEDREFRQGLPLNYLDYMGVANSESVSSHGKNWRKRHKLKLQSTNTQTNFALISNYYVLFKSDCVLYTLWNKTVFPLVLGCVAGIFSGKQLP